MECYLCGRTLSPEAANLDNRPTRDHVPPRSLFPRPLPNNLITLPCCRPCQQAYAQDEEYVFQNLAPLAPASTNVHARELWPRAKRGIKRSAALTRDFDSRLRRVAIDEGGGVQDRLAVMFDTARANRVFRKIARGLLYHHTGTRDDAHDSAKVHWQPRDVPELQQLVNLAQHRERINDAFAYAGGIAVDNPQQSIWVLWFFDHVAVVTFGADNA